MSIAGHVTEIRDEPAKKSWPGDVTTKKDMSQQSIINRTYSLSSVVRSRSDQRQALTNWQNKDQASLQFQKNILSENYKFDW